MKTARIHVGPYFGLMDTLDGNTGDAVKNFPIQVGLGIPVGAGFIGRKQLLVSLVYRWPW